MAHGPVAAKGSAVNFILRGRDMAYTHHELKHKTLAELRDIAKDIEHEAVQGYTQLNKEHLVVALCKALNIDMHEHHQVVGVDKAAIKSRIKALKAKRDTALAAHDHKQLKIARRGIHRLKRQIHKATV
jgi:DNA-binding IclR family transcriptional regulator